MYGMYDICICSKRYFIKVFDMKTVFIKVYELRKTDMGFWKTNKEHTVFITKYGFVLHESLKWILHLKIMDFMYEFLYASKDMENN